MFKKLVLALLFIIILAGAYAAYRFFTSATNFDEKSKYLYIPTNKATYPDLLQTIRDSQFVKDAGSFDFLARRLSLDEKVKPGRYEIKKGMNLSEIVRMLRNGSQSPVNLTIKKLRTKENLASLIGRRLETDSADVIHFLNNPDSLKKYELDSNTAMAMIFPNTYTYFWNADLSSVIEKLHDQYEKVWTDERRNQAKQHGLTPVTAYVLASIVEEETNDQKEKGNIASVYLNRVRKGMRLQADPTVKFAMREFGLKRIYEKHLFFESPYNTYRNTGLPPGPICTPSLETLDAVLQSPETNYLYFVVKSDFSGSHEFSATYEEHMIKARAFHQALNEEEKKRDANR